MGEENNHDHVNKKTRLEVEQDDMLQLQAWRRQQNQFLQSISTSQRPAFLTQQQYIQHQDRLRQQQQALQRLQLQQQQQQQLRRHLQQQIPPNVSAHQRFMMFLYHIKQRPEDNCITFWRKLVAEYYSPRAKQRLCFSQNKSAAGHMLGMLPQDVWQCDLCGTKSGKGVEATYDVLARLFEIRYASGVVDELLTLEGPREYRVSNGLMVLEYRKMVQTTVYEQCRVVHEGPLRIIFSRDLKILSWQFCTRRHEEFLVRRLIAPKVNQLIEVAQKCQSTISESGPEGVSQQDLQTNSNMVLEARRQLANSMGVQFLNDHGYPKKYARALQTYEVVKSMKELMDFTYEHKVGPIEGWKRLSEQAEAMRLQRQKMQEMVNSGAMNRWSAQAQTGNNNNNNSYNHHHSSSGQAAAALNNNNNNQIMLMRRLNAMNTGRLEGFPSQLPTPNSNQSPYWSHQRQNLAIGGFLSSPPQMQQQQHGTPNTLQQTHLPEDATEIIPEDFSDGNFSDKIG